MERETKFKKDRMISGIAADSTGEYVLPDYKGDVRKILETKVVAVPSGRFPGQGRVEFVGRVVYKVVYLDNENQISGVEFDSDYQFEVACDDESYVDAICHTRVANFNIRLMGPRKFSVKANLDSSVLLTENSGISLLGDVFERDSVEKSTEILTVGAAIIGHSEDKEYKEIIAEIDGAIEEEIDILMLNAEPRVASVVSHDGEAEITGDVTVLALVTRNSEMPYTLTAKMPINERISVEGLKENTIATGFIHVTECASSVEPTEAGVAVTLKLSLNVDVFSPDSERVEVFRDCYLCDAECDNEYGIYTYPAVSESITAGENLSFEIPIATTGIESIRNIVDLVAAVYPEECIHGESGTDIRGKIRFSGIACEIKDGGDLEYSPLKMETPFDIKVNNSCHHYDKTHTMCRINPRDLSFSLDSENIYLSLALDLNITESCSLTASLVKSSKVIRELDNKDGSKIMVYYPTDSDSLFDIAKKYHTTVMDIAATNSLTESVFNSMSKVGSLSGIKKLIIR